MDNIEFSTALCLRYHQPIPYIEAFERCPCCKKNGHSVDVTGHHYISGCKTDIRSVNGFKQKNQIHAIHDQLRYTLAGIASHARAFCIQEARSILYNPTSDKQTIPDLHLQFVPIPDDTATRNVVVDLSLVCPFIGCESGKLKTGVSDSITHDQFFHSNEPKKYKNDPKYYNQRGQQRKVSKDSRYKTAMDYVNGNGQKKVQFVPFIINTTGMIHSDGYNLLVRLAKHAALSRHVADGHKEFLNYYLKIMSITLMKLVARTMFAKSVNNFTATTLHNNAQVRVGNRAVFTEETANRRSTYLGNIHRDDIE